MEIEVKEYCICSCGAITIYTDDGMEYSCSQRQRLRKKYFPGLDLRKVRRLQPPYSCNWCVNHYGLDLCGCGSGEEFGKCTNGLEECAHPMQVLGEMRAPFSSEF